MALSATAAARIAVSGHYVTRRFSTNPRNLTELETIIANRVQFCNKYCYNRDDRTFGSCSFEGVKWLNSQNITVAYPAAGDPEDMVRVLTITKDQVHKMACPIGDGREPSNS